MRKREEERSSSYRGINQHSKSIVDFKEELNASINNWSVELYTSHLALKRRYLDILESIIKSRLIPISEKNNEEMKKTFGAMFSESKKGAIKRLENLTISFMEVRNRDLIKISPLSSNLNIPADKSSKSEKDHNFASKKGDAVMVKSNEYDNSDLESTIKAKLQEQSNLIKEIKLVKLK